MHWCRLIAQIYLILSVRSLVLAAPVVVQRIHEARSGDLEMGSIPNVPTVPNEPGDVGAGSHGSVSPPSSPPNGMASPEHSHSSGAPTSPGHPTQNVATVPNEVGDLEAGSYRSASPPSSPHANEIASLEHSPSFASSGYPTPHLSETSSVSGSSWMLDRPPRLDPYYPEPKFENLPASGSGSAALAHLPEDEPVSLRKASIRLLKVLGIAGSLAGAVWGLNKIKPRASDRKDD